MLSFVAIRILQNIRLIQYLSAENCFDSIKYFQQMGLSSLEQFHNLKQTFFFHFIDTTLKTTYTQNEISNF